MNEFLDYFTNPNYIGGYNAIMSGNVSDKEKGVVYVEDESDVWFWRTLIEIHFPNQYEYKTASKANKNHQGKIALRQFYQDLNAKILVARDADYDWLCPSQDDLNNPYILHTFAYSKESVLMEKKSIDVFFKGISHTHRHNVSMNDVLGKLSVLIFRGLCWLVSQFLKYKSISNINLDEFNKHYHILDKQLILDDLIFDMDVFGVITENIDRHLAISDNDFHMAKCHLSSYGIDENNAYRFISGHYLDEFVNKAHEQLCNQLLCKEMNGIRQNFEGKVINERQKQLNHIFKHHFSLPTYYRQYLIDDNDEIHQRILNKIRQIK